MYPKAQVTEFAQSIGGDIHSRPRTWDETASHVFGNLINRLTVQSDWIDHAESNGETGSSLVLVWGTPKPDGSARILAWYEINI